MLRAIETGEFRPVGAKRDVKSAFRLVAATNQPLDEAAEAGSFREDLLHRFGKMVLRVPPLRARPGDVPILVQHFLSVFGSPGAHEFAPDAMDALTSHGWPGNVRELRSVVETSVALAERSRISLSDVAAVMVSGRRRPVYPRLEAELKLTVEAFRRASGNADAVAEELGVHRSTVYRRVQRAHSEGIASLE